MNAPIVRVQLTLLAVAVVVVAALTYRVVEIRQGDVAKDQELRAILRELAEKNAAVDSEMLKARDGLEPSFDTLVDTVAAEMLALDKLKKADRIAELTKTNVAFGKAMTGLTDHLETKRKLLDDVKYRHAVIVNSSRYFPRALADARDAASDSLIKDGQREVEDALLRYVLSRDNDDQTELDLVLQQMHTQAPFSDDPGIRNLAKHANKIGTVGRSLDKDTNDALAIPTGADITALDAEYNKERSILEEKEGVLRGALAATSIALLACVAFVLRQISRTNASTRRFVPFQLLDILNRGSLTDVKCGDAVQREMHILFADIRNFTKRMEAYTPEQAFGFMNQYLAAMGAPIKANNGFITEYRGDGILALFPDSADDALNAALGMLHALEGLNEKLASSNGSPLSKERVQIGIGIHSGHVQLGTVGDAERMNAGVIGHDVVMSSRVEGLTKLYKLPLLLSGNAEKRLKPHAFKLRRVDRVMVVGVDNAVEVYDVIGDDGARKTYDEAWAQYAGGKFKDARELFTGINGDAASAAMAARCSGYELAGEPPLWRTDPSMKGVHKADAK